MRLNTKSFYEFGPFRLEPDEYLLLRDGKPLALAPKAFELLIFLVQNPGRLLTKDQIMRAVWRDSFVEEANLTVWISILRKVLGEGEVPHYIETVPNLHFPEFGEPHIRHHRCARWPCFRSATLSPAPATTFLDTRLPMQSLLRWGMSAL